jgi:hypothetical protein
MLTCQVKRIWLFLILIFPFTFVKAESFDKIFFDLDNLCRKNHFESCGQIGLYFRDVVKDPKRAIYYYEKACSGGRSGACMHLASLYTNLIPDIEKRLQFSQKACTLGEPIGCAMAGLTLAHDLKDEKLAEKYFKKACDGNNETGCEFLGYYYLSESEKKSNLTPLAIKTLQKGCSLKSQASCDHLSTLKDRIRGENKCVKKKASLEKSCEVKDCSEEIISFIRQGCLKNDELIIPLMEKNCLKFKSVSCHEVSGLHLFRDRFDKSAKFSALSCKDGYHNSCSINKFSKAMLSNDGKDILNTINELLIGCYVHKKNGDCDLVFTLAKNKKKYVKIDFKKLSFKGCELNSSTLCIAQAEFISQEKEKLKILQKACDLENQLGCFKAGKLLKDGSFLQKLKALKLLRQSCSGHELDRPVEFGCGDLAILEVEFYNLIPTSNNIKFITFAALGACLIIYLILKFRRRESALQLIEKKTLALEDEFNKKRKDEILRALEKIE